jgi:hypothetical protein
MEKIRTNPTRSAAPINWGAAAKSLAVLAVETGLIEPVAGLCLGALVVAINVVNPRPHRRAA